MSTSIRTPDLGTALFLALAAIGTALVLALFVLASPAVSGSNDLFVNSTDDIGDATPDGVCDSDPDPLVVRCTLREAIQEANAFSVDNIDVQAGTYKLTLKGSGEDNAATGDLDILKGVTIRPDEGNGPVIIDGNGIDRVFHTPFQGTSTPFTLSIFGVKVTGGAVPDSVGGGIFHNAEGATLFLSNSTVSGNSANQGGGIKNGASGFGGPMTIKRSTISGNKAPGGQGGGIQNSEALTLENTTVSGNKSLDGGGIKRNGGTLTITDSTIASNTAQQPGGGISASSGVTVKNSIVSNNKSNLGKNCSNPVTSQGNNLEKGTTCGFNQSGDINADPKLGKLKNNGGPTNTRALQNGSPAIDAGPAACPPPATDQRDVPRPRDGNNDGTSTCDIGAYEK